MKNPPRTGNLIRPARSSRITVQPDRKTTPGAAAENLWMILEHVQDFVSLLDASGRRIYVSPSYTALLGERASQPGYDSFADVHPEDRERIRRLFQETFATGIGHRAEFRLRLEDGSVRYIESQGSPIRDASGKVSMVVVVSRDITERRHAEARVRYLAQHDPLTGLANRTLLYDRIGLAIARASRYGEKVAVVYVDLDCFKPVNDEFGHEVGDRLLCEVGRRLAGCLREADTVARFGGDEFVVVIPELKHAADVKPVVAKMLHELSRPCLLDGLELRVGASIGVSLYPTHGNTVEALLRRADAAMYEAKRSGRNAYRFFRLQQGEKTGKTG